MRILVMMIMRNTKIRKLIGKMLMMSKMTTMRKTTSMKKIMKVMRKKRLIVNMSIVLRN